MHSSIDRIASDMGDFMGLLHIFAHLGSNMINKLSWRSDVVLLDIVSEPLWPDEPVIADAGSTVSLVAHPTSRKAFPFNKRSRFIEIVGNHLLFFLIPFFVDEVAGVWEDLSLY
jgi:hypothetical protein